MSTLQNITLLTTSLLLATVAQAQVSVSLGPQVGETLANRHIASSGNSDYRFGLAAGAQASFSWGRFALQPALLFSQKGGSYSQEVDYRDPNSGSPSQHGTYTTKLRLNYLTLPVNFAFAPMGTATGPQFLAGPYVSMLLGGNLYQAPPGQASLTTPVCVYTADQITAPGSYYAQRFDAGLQAGLGFRLEHVVLQAEYSLGLRNLGPAYPNMNTLVAIPAEYTRAFQTSVTYLFAFKPKP